jgi:hypothetical protein
MLRCGMPLLGWRFIGAADRELYAQIYAGVVAQLQTHNLCTCLNNTIFALNLQRYLN